MIKSYEKNNETYWEVSVIRKSSKIRSIRVQKRSTGIKSRRKAELVEKKLIQQAISEVVQKEAQGLTWKKVIEKWELSVRFGQDDVFRKRHIGKGTINEYVGIYKKYTQAWMKTPITQITRADVKIVLSQMLKEGKSQSRVRNVKAALNTVFNWAIDEGIASHLKQSPAEGFNFKRKEETKPEILNINEIRQLLKLAKEQNHPWYPIWVMALMTGCRSGELYALKWSDVDFESKRIEISKSYSSKIKGIKSTKAGYWREVPISQELELFLKELRLSSKSEFVLPRLPHWRTGGAAQVLKQFCLGNGLTLVKFHTLRACFATQLIKDGVAPAIVMKICGWRDLKTMQRYVRLAGIEVEGATNSLKLLPEDVVMGRVVELFNGDV